MFSSESVGGTEMLHAGSTVNQYLVGDRTKKKTNTVMTFLIMGILALSLTFSALPSFAATYDVASDFSPTSNPAGAWSYGWSSLLTSALDLYSFNGNDRGIDLWADTGTLYPPTVSYNGTSSAITLSPEAITWQPGQFALHPGGGGEYSHARWTAPAAGTYYIFAEFSGIDQNGPTTDVHVLHNTSSLFTGTVAGYGDTASYSTTISVGAGDFIDFAVGYGVGGYLHDTTALAAIISTDPTAVGDGTNVPNPPRLVGIYPNPFNPHTWIRYDLAQEASVQLQIYDVQGMIVRTLVAGQRPAGSHTETWNGCNDSGTPVASGVYVARLAADGVIQNQKMVLVR